MGQTPNQFTIYQINYNNSCVCLTVKEKIYIYILLSHTLIISLKDSNTLLSPFYFLLHAQLSLGCLLFSKQLTLVCSLSFFLYDFLFLCSCTYSLCVFSKVTILSWFDALFFFSPKGGLLGQSQRQSQQLLCSIVCL